MDDTASRKSRNEFFHTFWNRRSVPGVQVAAAVDHAPSAEANQSVKSKWKVIPSIRPHRSKAVW